MKLSYGIHENAACYVQKTINSTTNNELMTLYETKYEKYETKQRKIANDQ